MLLPGKNSPKTWLFVTVLVTTTIALSEPSRAKMLDFKIGFDLIPRDIGASALQKGSTEFNPRAMEKETDLEDSASAGKASNSRSEERPHPKKEDSTKEKEKTEEEDRGDDGHDDDVERITRGPKNNDFEPEEENPSIHAKFNKDSDSDKNSDEDRRRYKRHITFSAI